MSKMKSKKKDSSFPIFNQKLLLILLFIIGAFYLLGKNNINSILGTNYQNSFKSQPTIIPTDTPTPIECIIGNSTFTLPNDSCQSIKKTIDDQRQKDSDKVTQLLHNLYVQIQNLNNPPSGSLSANINSYLDTIQNYSDKMNAIRNLATILGNKLKQNEEYKAQLEKQWAFYQNYYNHIQSGVGNGACSGHDGVDCPAGRGNIGQVICNDGWDQSSVYYFNVKECVSYYVNSQ